MKKTLSRFLFLFTASITLTNSSYADGMILDQLIGYPQGIGPVPLSPECLYAQIVYGRSTTIHSRSVVEPTIAVNPQNSKYIVAAWQQGRITNGGSLECTIAYSKNGGKQWNRTTVPFQICDGGLNQRVSDVWLSYSADGNTLYLTALTINATKDINTQNQLNVVVTTSKDNGENWSHPTFIFASQGELNEPTGAFPFPDKNSITADRNHVDLAYAVYDVFPQAVSFHSDTVINITHNSGITWSQNRIMYDPYPDLVNTNLSNGIYNDCQTINNVVVVQPQGSSDLRQQGNLLNFMVRQYAAPGASDDDFMNDSFPFQYTLFDIASVRSTDLGETWDSTALIVEPFVDAQVYTGGYTYSGGNVTGGVGTLLRTGDLLPSYNINPKNGNLYVVYQTGEFRSDFLPQIGIKASYDGGHTWSNSAQVSRTPLSAPNPQAFTPFVAVTEFGYVGVLYFDFRNDSKSNPDETLTDAWLAIYKETSGPGSTGIGLDFVKEIRLSKNSYIAQNGPSTTQGVMTNGDYPFLVAEGNSFYAIYTKSQNGPFSPPIPLIIDAGSSLYLDDNYRSAPYFSLVQ